MKRFLTNSFNQVMGKLTGTNKHEVEYEFEIPPEPEFELKPLEELEKIEFSPRDYEKTSDFRKNISLYQKGLEKIRAKYRAHVLDTCYLNSEDLIRRESERNSFCKKANILPEELEQKIDDYCRKNKIPYQELYIPKENVDPIIKEELEQTIAAQAELEKIKFLARDHNCPEEWLEKGVSLAKIYRSPEEIAVLEKMLEEAKAKGEGGYIRDGVKLMIANTILNDIELDSNLSGERREGTKYASNWEKKLELLKKNLEEKGIYLDERYEGHQTYKAEIKQTWAGINKQIQEENAVKRSFENILDEVLRKHPDVRFELYCAEIEQRSKKRGLEEHLEDARKYASDTVGSRTAQEQGAVTASRNIQDDRLI